MPPTPQTPRPATGRRLARLFGWLPLVDLVLLAVLASHFGWQPVVAFVLAGFVLGFVITRKGSPRAKATLREMLGRGPTPDHHLSGQAGGATVYAPGRTGIGTDLADDALFLLAGQAVAVPGVILTVAGLALLVPPVRRMAARWLSRQIADTARARVDRMLATEGLLVSGTGTVDDPAAVVYRAGFQPSSPQPHPQIEPGPAHEGPGTGTHHS